MMPYSIRSFLDSWFRRPNRRERRRKPQHAGIRLEQLEDRLAPAATLVAEFPPASSTAPPPVIADSSTVAELVDVNGTLFFRVMPGVSTGGNVGNELWKSDGTAAGTVLVKDINHSSDQSDFHSLTNVSGTVFFISNDAELWKSDGTAAGTVLLKTLDDPISLTNVNGTLFFQANADAQGDELWKSDGTAAGTVLVKDFVGGTVFGDRTNVNGTLFFRASDGVHGSELWKSDGTAAGTVLVKDIKPGSSSSGPHGLTNVNGTLFFFADDGVHGDELWKSDGTAAGTVMVKDILPGSYGNIEGNLDLINVNGVLFFAADDGVHGEELWKSDGTEAGTVLLRDIHPGKVGSYPGLVNVNGTLFFAASDGVHGYELWKSNGTTAGTVMVKDIKPGSSGGCYGSFTNVNGTLFFLGNDGVHGLEVWMSNGTAAGTVMVGDILPGNNRFAERPLGLTNVNGTLFFVEAYPPNNKPTSGVERLWKAVQRTFTFTDQDGDRYTIQLAGPGSIRVVQDDADGDGKGPIAQISLQDTNPLTSTLGVTVTKAATGNGLVSIGSITASSGLLGISAPAANLAGSGITVTGLLGSLRVRDVLTGATIKADGTAAQRTSLIAHVLEDGTTVDVGSSLSLLQAARVGDGVIKAPAIGTLRVLGDAPKSIHGDFGADLTLSGTGDPLKPTSLTSATIAGAIAGATWQVTGNVGPVTARGAISNWTLNGSGNVVGLTLGAVASATVQAAGKINTVSAKGWTSGSLTAGSVNVLRIIGDLGANVTLTGNGVTAGLPTLNVATVSGTVNASTLTVTGIVNVFTAGAFLDSLLLAGFAPTDQANPMGGGTFTAGSRINSFRTIGFTGLQNSTFANSTVAASDVRVVSLFSVQGDNTDKLFGVLADTSIVSVIVKTPAFSFNKALATPQGFDDFKVAIQ